MHQSSVLDSESVAHEPAFLLPHFPSSWSRLTVWFHHNLCLWTHSPTKSPPRKKNPGHTCRLEGGGLHTHKLDVVLRPCVQYRLGHHETSLTLKNPHTSSLHTVHESVVESNWRLRSWGEHQTVTPSVTCFGFAGLGSGVGLCSEVPGGAGPRIELQMASFRSLT